MSFAYPKVQFQCTKCGICCGDTKERIRHILILEFEAKQISKETLKEIQDFSIEIQDKKPYQYEIKKTGGKCIFLNDKTCRIYPKRPMICQFYPFELKFDEAKNKYRFECTRECPGVDSGTGRFMDELDFKRLFRLANNRLK